MGAHPSRDEDLQLVSLIHKFIFSLRCFWLVFKIRSKAVSTLFILTSQTPCRGCAPSWAVGKLRHREPVAQHPQWELDLLLGGLIIFLANLPGEKTLPPKHPGCSSGVGSQPGPLIHSF